MFWYHADLERLEKKIEELNYKPKSVFFGSSTFTLWNELELIFEEHKPINLGFGGSTLASCTWFFERIFKNITTIDSIIIYAGDNDLGEGRHPEEVILFLENLLEKIRIKYGDIKCTCISIKPSLARRHLQDSIHYTNECIKKVMSKRDNYFYINIFDAFLDDESNPNKKYFEQDGLHFNKLGYKVLKKALKKNEKIFPEKILENI
jgi:lysophospholipase L1-like esterase